MSGSGPIAAENGMSDRHLLAITERLQAVVASGNREQTGPIHWLDTARYLDPERWRAEADRVFRTQALIAARRDQLSASRPWLGVELAGHAILLSCDEHGEVRAFVNACRHRGMQLLEPGEDTCKRHLSCPYHGWTYDSGGRLRGLPHADAFPELEVDTRGLVELPCAVRHGFVWVVPRPQDKALDIPAWLGSIDADFQHFDLAGHVTYAEARQSVPANWKLCVDAFLEAYHVQVLHRQTVGPFFEDALACSDSVGRHFRSAVARKQLREGQLEPLREAVSFTYLVFPNQIFVVHPDYISQLSILPRGSETFDWHHRMLIPAAEDTPELREHWDRSYALIEKGVFASEDLFAAARIQRGLRTGANRRLPLGQLEHLIADFHRQLDALLET